MKPSAFALFAVLATAAHAFNVSDGTLVVPVRDNNNITFIKEVTLTVQPPVGEEDLTMSAAKQDFFSVGLKLLDPLMRLFDQMWGETAAETPAHV